MQVRRSFPLILLVTCLLVTGCTTSPGPSQTADRSPSASPAPVTAEDLAAGENPSGVDVQVDGASQVVFRRITLSPGAGTGEHCHAGQLIAVVERGALTHYAPIYPEGKHIYTTGDAIVEGAGYIHHGVNEGAEDVVLLVTYVIEAGEPLAQTDLMECDR